MKPAPVVSRHHALLRGWDMQNRETWTRVYVVGWNTVNGERWARIRYPWSKTCVLAHPSGLRRSA